MSRSRRNTLQWQWMIGTLVVILSSLILFDLLTGLSHWNRHGSLGFILEKEYGNSFTKPGFNELRVKSLDPDTEATLPVGTQLSFTNPEDRWRQFKAGESAGIRISAPEPDHLVAMKRPFNRYELADVFSRTVLSALSIGCCVLVALKRPQNKPYQALSQMFLGFGALYFITSSFGPWGWLIMTEKAVCYGALPFIWYFCVVFALGYQPYHESHLRTALNHSRYVLLAIASLTALAGICWSFGLTAHPVMKFLTESLLPGLLFCAAFGLIVTLISLIDGLRQSTGEFRHRHGWLLASTLLCAIPSIVVWIPWPADVSTATAFIALGGQCAMYVGLSYATLKHRVFNFDFAVNRLVVYGLSSLLMILLLGGWELFAHDHVKEFVKGIGGDALAVLALLSLFVLYHYLHHKVEKLVEEYIFSVWHHNELRLKQFVAKAEHFTSDDALLTAFRVALVHFTRHGDCAIYKINNSDGNFELVRGKIRSCPTSINKDEPIAIALRALLMPIHSQHHTPRLPGELLLPMTHRGALIGFVVLGGKGDHQNFRPDEVKVLATSALQIGLDLHALQAEQMSKELKSVTSKAEKQQVELSLMAGRRRNGRAQQVPVGMAAPHDLQSSA